MLRIGPRTKNLLLGTATPIQTEVSELWDLMRILNAGADFVLGREMFSHWADWRKALPVVKGGESQRTNATPGNGCAIRCRRVTRSRPLPVCACNSVSPATSSSLTRASARLEFFEQQTVLQTLAPGYYREHNPIVRHTVLRRRQTLEEAGLLEQVAVDIHPHPQHPATLTVVWAL